MKMESEILRLRFMLEKVKGEVICTKFCHVYWELTIRIKLHFVEIKVYKGITV